MTNLIVNRAVNIPDDFRIARYRSSPEFGPRILFFSGGTALRPLSRALVDYTHNSIHVITAFDSGGSSAVIRNAFGILSVGDLRSRLMDLADKSLKGNPDVYDLFTYRFPKRAANVELHRRLRRMSDGKDPFVKDIPSPVRRIILNHLHYFLEHAGGDFNLRGASIGNLVLAGGYLNNRNHIEPVIYMFSKLVEVRGAVKPITGLSFHLAAQLKNGKTLVGQHVITDKKHPLDSPIEKLFLIGGLDEQRPVSFRIKKKVHDLIGTAELICYPMGSFYTSVIANLLPEGVGQAVSVNHCPKVYLPNPYLDFEQHGLSFDQTVATLLRYLEKSCDDKQPVSRLLNFVLLDSRNGDYPRPLNLKKISDLGVQVIDTELITPKSAPRYDEKLVIEALLSLT